MIKKEYEFENVIPISNVEYTGFNTINEFNCNEKMKMSVIIIGLGNIGLTYDLDSMIPTQMTHTGACLGHDAIGHIYGVDPDCKRRALFEKETNSSSFSSIAELRQKISDVDLCIISTPTSLRKEVLKECIALTPQAILIEKPLSDNLQEANRIKALCEEHEIAVYINYIRLFDPSLKHLKKQISEKQFGSFCGGGCFFSGGILNIASHYISLVINMFGEPEKINVICADEGKEFFILEFLDFNFFFKAVTTEYATGEIELWFPEHKITINNTCMNIMISGCEENPLFAGYKCLGPPESFPADLHNYQYNVLDYIISNMIDEKNDSNSLNNAYKTLELCMAVTG